MRRLAAAAAALASTWALANGDAPRWYLQVDNDVVFGTDRWYSSGVRLARAAGDGTEWGLLQEVYTPEAKRWRPGIDDRAPSARLLAYHARHALTAGSLGTLELALGVRGPSALGREATDAIHELVPAPEVDWSREERDRVDVQLGAARSLAGGGLVLHYGAVAGNHQAFAHGGIEWRVGLAARAAHSPAMRYVATPPPAAGAPGWSAFAGLSIRAVARNRMIRRNYDAAGQELDLRRAVLRIAGGVAFVQPWGAATLALVSDTREFGAQRRAHGFGVLSLHVGF